MVHAPFRWESIGEFLDGHHYDYLILAQLEAELHEAFEQDDRELEQCLDWCFDQIEATICVLALISHIEFPSADQSDEGTNARVDLECMSE